MRSIGSMYLDWNIDFKKLKCVFFHLWTKTAEQSIFIKITVQHIIENN